MDGKTFHLWAKIETLDKASEDKPGKSAPSSDNGLKGGPKTEKTYNYKEAWEKTAVKVYGYEGVNAIGIDFK